MIITISVLNFPSQSLLTSIGCSTVQELFPKSCTYEFLGWLIDLIYLHVTSNIKLWIMHNSVSTAQRRRGCVLPTCDKRACTSIHITQELKIKSHKANREGCFQFWLPTSVVNQIQRWALIKPMDLLLCGLVKWIVRCEKMFTFYLRCFYNTGPCGFHQWSVPHLRT